MRNFFATKLICFLMRTKQSGETKTVVDLCIGSLYETVMSFLNMYRNIPVSTFKRITNYNEVNYDFDSHKYSSV